MTERLSQLLAGEADGLDVPPPSPQAVLRQGRGLRRRRTLVAGAAGAAAAVVVAGSVFALSAGGDGRDATPDPAGAPAGGNAVYSYGNVVFYDGPEHSVEVDDTAVKSLYYTSAGVLVRHGDNANSDGGGPQRFSLVTPDGTVQRLGLVTEETVHASDPDQPYVVYGEQVDGGLEVVVYDVTTDSETARVPVAPTKDNWFPVSIDGDTVYVQNGYEGGVFAVDWRDGGTTAVELEDAWDIVEGRKAVQADGRAAVIDVATGDVLVTADTPGTFELSPDGSYAELSDEDEVFSEEPSAEFEVYDVDTGSSTSFSGTAWDWGWTADGDLFKVGKDAVTTCDAGAGDCTEAAYSQPNVPDPPPVTYTYKEPVCSPDMTTEECFSEEFYNNCNAHPGECEWQESRSVDDPVVELRLGGRTYES